MVISPGTENEVLSPQVKQTITELEYFLVENIRTARRFISALKLGLTIEDLQFEELNRKTEINDLYQYLQKLREGISIGVLSESGCPGVADPGSLAVELAHDLGAQVVPLVGPSSILLTLMASGLNGQAFAFHGYLPIQDKDRQHAIRELEKESQAKNCTQLFIETPYRNQKMFESLINTCRPSTRLCVAVDITGKEEQIHTSTIEKWKRAPRIDLHKMPAVFAILA